MRTRSAVTEQIRDRISGVADLYHQLVLVVGPSGTGKSAVLRELAQTERIPLVNVGVELSRRLLDLTERQRALQAPVLLEETVRAISASADVVLLDNTEILFASALKQDPLRLLQSLSRQRRIVAAWLGSVHDGYLTYAVPEHPEFRRYSLDGLVVVPLDDGGRAEQIRK